MFLMIGINEQRKDLPCGRVMICSRCGSYGRYSVYMTCMCFSLFFIPLFKWKRQYYAETSCCGTVYMLDPDIGRRIEHGEDIEIRPEHLREISRGCGRSYGGSIKRCAFCGYEVRPDFEYCPKCGRRL